ncbi:MAG TPA: winged helix-turn-helix domain-containing protein [Xanthobacteraceae bacterium]|nr:winged helix-turn-helix domain-containing protein [Xanthobacteraceae bacterium]
MPEVADHPEEITFGSFRLDVRRRSLQRDGQPVALGARSFDILCVLVALRGNLVTRDDLSARVWPGAIVEANTVHVHVAALRKALGDGSAGQRYIATAPGRGYRFVGDIAESSLPVIPEQPSIAVLPFQSFSGDLDDYFADGMVEEIITALTRFPALFVIARNSSFAYKGRAVDIRQVGRELGVRYVLEGSARRSADRLRITAQLIEATTGAHIWADRFDGELSDVFELQDEVTARIVGAIAPKLQLAEIERVKRVPTESLRSYDCYLRGLVHFHRDERQANRDALEMFTKAIELDPDFATAHGMAAWCYNQRLRNGWLTDLAQARVEARRLALRAAELGREDAVALTTAGSCLAQVTQELDAGIALIDRARSLNPNFATAWASSAWARNYCGEAETAIDHAARAIRLSPLDPLSHYMDAAMAFAHFLAGRYDEAVRWAEIALPKHGGYQGSHRILAASHALAGRLDAARAAFAGLRALNPQMRIADLRTLIPWRRPDDARRYAEGLRLAGLPD